MTRRHPSFSASSFRRGAIGLAAYCTFISLTVAGLLFSANRIADRAAAPVAALLNLGDGYKIVDKQAPVAIETASRVLESDAWLDSLKTKWHSETRSSPSSRTESRLGGPAPAVDRAQSGSRSSSRQTHRTMCVRLCDGYYFPISFATTEDKFERDEAVCERSCSSPAKLYVYRNPGEEPEQMVSVAGRPYSKLPTAFQFRTKLDQSCKCTPDPWEQEAQNRHRQYAEVAARNTVQPVPDRRQRGGKPGRVTELAPVQAAAGPVRIANASAGVSILNMQVSTSATGPLPQAGLVNSGFAVVPGGITGKPENTVIPSVPKSEVKETARPEKKKAAAAKVRSRPATVTAEVPKTRAKVPVSTDFPKLAPSRSSDWKVAVFAGR